MDSTPTVPARPKNKAAPGAGSLAETVLARAQAGRAVVQEFVPLAESLEWQLGQDYLRERGNKAFISDASPVPFVINNDGTLSRNAAEVFFASLVEAERAGPLEPTLFVLELGIGVGLFARFFLDHFQELCFRHRKDYYDRLCYVAADRSERMLLDVCRHGVLSQHPGRVCIRQVDAMSPESALPADARFQGISGPPFRAVFLNYLLDCLPAAVLDVGGDEVKQLCVRTCVARNIHLTDHTDMSLEALGERARSGDPRGRQDLLEVYGLFASEYDYRPVDPASLPLGPWAVAYGRPKARRVLHNYGAIQSLEKLLALLRDDGFILINDYGQTQMTAEGEFEHQRFSLATFVGVNFPLLRAYFGEGKRAQWIEPPEEGRSIHSRLLSRKPSGETVTTFYQRFSAAAFEALDVPMQQARVCIKMGRFELAATFYQEALKLQPRNWVVLNEVSTFLTFQLRDAKAGTDMAKVAITLNPTCSAELWSTLGDALFESGRTAEARSAYLRALYVNESDVRARYNLAWTYQRDKDFPAALDILSEALALDKTGAFRQRVLQKQQEVLTQLAAQYQQEYLLLINLVSKYTPTEKDKPPESGTFSPVGSRS